MGGIGNCCCDVSCAELLGYAPPRTTFRGIYRLGLQWANPPGVSCCPQVGWTNADYVLKQIFNYGDFCVDEFSPQQWCTTASLDEMTLSYTKFDCTDSWYLRMTAKIYCVMGHVSPIYGSPPQPHGTCGPPNPIFSGGGWIYLTRDKLLTNLNPTQTIEFTSTDHYADEDCFDPFPCGGLSEEVGTTVYGWCGNSLPTVTGPFNPTYIDFLDVDFTFDITA